MENNFAKLMLSKSDEGLQEYIDNRNKYTPDAIYAAIDELKKRGRVFSDDEFNQIVADINKQQEISNQRVQDSEGGWFKNTKNVVNDPEAPAYYSEKAILSFSLLFSVLFGSILLAININSAEKRKFTRTVLLFGVGYTALQMWILSLIPRNTGLTLGVSAGGGIILNEFFFKKYIGKDTKYRARPIWIPLIIALIITVPLVYIAITSQE